MPQRYIDAVKKYHENSKQSNKFFSFRHILSQSFKLVDLQFTFGFCGISKVKASLSSFIVILPSGAFVFYYISVAEIQFHFSRNNTLGIFPPKVYSSLKMLFPIRGASAKVQKQMMNAS